MLPYRTSFIYKLYIVPRVNVSSFNNKHSIDVVVLSIVCGIYIKVTDIYIYIYYFFINSSLLSIINCLSFNNIFNKIL
jgi:hypothetical protein